MLVSAYANFSVDTLVTKQPALLMGYAIHATLDGGIAEIYDGLDVLSGRHVQSIVGWVADPNTISFNHPILFNNGIYVDVGANVHDITIYYVPLRGASPLKPYPDYIIIDTNE